MMSLSFATRYMRIYEIWGFQGGENVDCGILGCEVV
jgi:hypothetical protein